MSVRGVHRGAWNGASEDELFAAPAQQSRFRCTSPARRWNTWSPLETTQSEFTGMTAIRAASIPTTTSVLFAPAPSARRHARNVSMDMRDFGLRVRRARDLASDHEIIRPIRNCLIGRGDALLIA